MSSQWLIYDFYRGDFGNQTRTEKVWAYGRILCICELGRAGADAAYDRGV